jgi:hypothetical protein
MIFPTNEEQTVAVYDSGKNNTSQKTSAMEYSDAASHEARLLSM